MAMRSHTSSVSLRIWRLLFFFFDWHNERYSRQKSEPRAENGKIRFDWKMQKLCCDLCPFTFFPGRHCRLSSRRGSIPDLEMAFGNEMAVHVSCRRGEGTDTVYIKHNFRTRTHSILRQHQILQVYKCLDRFFDSNHLYKHILRFCIRTLCSFGVVVSIRTYI